MPKEEIVVEEVQEKKKGKKGKKAPEKAPEKAPPEKKKGKKKEGDKTSLGSHKVEQHEEEVLPENQVPLFEIFEPREFESPEE